MLTVLVFTVYALFALAFIAALDWLCKVRGWTGEIPGPKSTEKEREKR